VVLSWKDSVKTTIHEFVQVKSDRQKQQWSIAQFCAQEPESDESESKKNSTSVRYRKDTSIFEKNALRDQGKLISKFRIVTRADVSELRVLTENHSTRKAADEATLAKKLTSKLEGNTSLTNADINYWISASTWDVRGDESAVFNDNFHHLAEVVQTQEKRLLSVADLERILHHLTDETRAMAMGKGRCGIDSSQATEKELREWLSKEVQAIPQFLGATETDALLREERSSLARCERLWGALGVSPSEAAALARQPDVGARTAFFAELPPGFHWIKAGYGAGKSLAVERLFQTHLSAYSTKQDSRIPIFFRAYTLKGTTLRDALLKRLRELHRDTSSPPLYVIIDAVDEAGISQADQLLQEALELSATWPGSTFITTSTDLPFNYDPSSKPLPKLTAEEAAEIVSYFAGHEIHTWQVLDRLKDDHGLPLMCVLLGSALKKTSDAAPSRAELLNSVVEAARKRSGADTNSWAEKSDILSRIAMRATDSGGGPVRPSELGMTNIDITPISATKLVAEESGNLIFTVATMRLWFAAQALRKGWITAEMLVADIPRARNWAEPLSIFIATTDFDSATRFLSPLAKFHPAIAAEAISDATRQWGDGSGRPSAEFETFALRMHNCLESWLQGISPLAKVCDFTDQAGNLLKLRAGYSEPHTVVIFSDDPSLPPVSALSEDWRNERGGSVILYRESNEPSYLWRKTHEMVCADLLKAVKRQRWQLADAKLFHEEIWNKAVDLTRVSRWFSDTVPWDLITRFEQEFQHFGMWEWLCEYKITHPEAFRSPHPPADTAPTPTALITNFYSSDAALARARSVYGMAFSAYQRIVTNYFPNFRHDLRHSAWWPCRLIGEVAPVQDGDWCISYYCEPVDSEKEAVVTLELGDRPDFALRKDLDKLRKTAIRLRPNAPFWFWAHGGMLDLHENCPASALVKQWLADDLRSAGWDKT
jgi:hypothetical protein